MTGTQLTRASSREAIIQGFSALALGVLAVVSFLYADAWHLVLGAVVLAAATAVCAACCALALRRDRVAPSPPAEA
ncbi:hypothetical protein [Arthrobacter sp. 260]|uniref:hypothetical protein n=1 Tax=Arthrobacter sp. 260 TaxID=2735314 RepID=UPI0014916503|nr:hypothetical protein [Arthrobacter sp. 260]NOJ61718.1 hypothetical protein [Arthrobacter sp. 260]